MKYLKYALAIAFWLVVWAVAACIVKSPLLLPGPWTTATRLASLFATGDFWVTIGITLFRVFGGLIAGITLGLILAAAAYRFPAFHTLIRPLLTVIRSTPVASFIMLFLLWLGRNWVPAVVAGLVCLPMIFENTLTGLKNMPKDLLEMAKAYHLSSFTQLKRIRIPSVLPYLQAALRNAAGMGWKAGIAAEVLTVPLHSIGKHIYESKLYLETEDLFAWTAAVIIISAVIELGSGALLRKVQRRQEHGIHN